jgi:AcrR family transcriptional regulator
MVDTPWGNAEELRDRRLPPGPGRSREEAARNQRERLFAAMVAVTSEKGYERTSVADLVELSGVARSAFYEHFEDLEDCFVATVERLLADAVTVIVHRTEIDAPWEERTRLALEAFVSLVALQPAAARLVLLESYAAGERAVAPVRGAIDGLGRLGRDALDQIPGHEGMPPELARAIIGGFYRVLYEAMQNGDEGNLPSLVPALLGWAMSYPAPPRPLRLRGRRGTVPVEAKMPPFAAYDPEQRIIRAFAAVIAKRGYISTTIADICSAASISANTFYEHFDDKADAMDAALDSSGAQMLAVAIPPTRRPDDWPGAVRAALRATCGFLAAEPAFAGLREVAAYGAGPQLLRRRDEADDELFGALLQPAFDVHPEIDPIVLKTIAGACHGVLYDAVRSGSPAALPEAVPLLTYIALTPFLGAAEACRIANDNQRPRRREA